MTIHVARPPAPQGAAIRGAAARPFVLALQGFVCDRYTSAGMHGAMLLARAAAQRLDAPLCDVGESEPARNLGWRASLARASPYLREAAYSVGQIMRRRRLPIIFANRCAASLATITAMLRHRPDTKIVWFDAHGDFNTPATSPTGYLGGMVLSALCGLWDSGFDAGLQPDRVILAGTRALDPGESKLTAEQGVRVVAAEDGTIDGGALIAAIGGASVWLHIDTDVIDPRYLPAEYRIEQGLRPSALHALLRNIVRTSELVGLELAEFEAPKNPKQSFRAVRTLMRMIAPVLAAATQPRL